MLRLHIYKDIDALTKQNVILHPWIPRKNYELPFSEHTKNGKIGKRYA